MKIYKIEAELKGKTRVFLEKEVTGNVLFSKRLRIHPLKIIAIPLTLKIVFYPVCPLYHLILKMSSLNAPIRLSFSYILILPLKIEEATTKRQLGFDLILAWVAPLYTKPSRGLGLARPCLFHPFFFSVMKIVEFYRGSIEIQQILKSQNTYSKDHCTVP